MDKRLPLQEFDIKESFSPMEDMGFFIDYDLVEFKHDAEKFDIGNAWYMADFSRIVYLEDYKRVRHDLKRAGFSKVKFFDNKGSQALVASNKKTIIVAFAGTELDEGFEDLLIDIDAIPEKFEKGGLVHRGFKKGLDYIWEDMVKYITPLLKNRTLWYTGHSLGAALATIAAALLPGNGMYTFGSPRVGSKAMLKNIECPVYRITKSRDIVTRIPPPPLYRHIGDVYFICAKYQIVKNPGFIKRFYERLGGSEWKILWLIIKLVIFKAGIGLIISYLHDHSPYNYSVFMWNQIEHYEEPEEIEIDPNLYLLPSM